MKPRIKLITKGLPGLYGVFVGGLYVWGSSSETAGRAWYNYRSFAERGNDLLLDHEGEVS